MRTHTTAPGAARLDLACFGLAGFGAAWLTCVAAAGTPAFSDHTAASGVGSVHQPSYGDLYLAGGTVGDFNGDGFQDIFHAVGGGAPDRLFLNNGNGTFTDRAADAGVALAHRSTNAAAGDFNNDGRLDLFVASLGTPGAAEPMSHRLYRNDGNTAEGVPVFTDVAAAAGVAGVGSSTDGYSVAWGDYDLDGDLDLAVAGFYAPQNNRVYRNNGDGTFTDRTIALGLDNSMWARMNGFSPRFTDMDGDRYPELIWIGDFGSSLYFRNDGGASFTEITAASGTGLDGTEMGCTVADVDRDGDFDFYVTTIGSNNLYLNQGNHTYVNTPRAAVQTGWGWGTSAIDFDHDGMVDLVATSQTGARQYAYRNAGNAAGAPQWLDVTFSSGFVSTVSGRGLSTLDIDNDGDQDTVIFPWQGPVTVLRNELDQSAGDSNWVRVLLDPADAAGIAPSGIGSVVKVTANGETQMGRVDGGSNYLSQSEMTAHFGLGTATVIDELVVEWTNGDVTTLQDVPANQSLTISAGGPPCVADIAEPFGLLDLADVQAFVAGFVTQDPIADLVPPSGIWDLADLQAFVNGFVAGCR